MTVSYRPMDRDLLALWCFDEADGPLAFNEVASGAPMQVRSATRGPGRNGRALNFRRGGDNAVAPGLGTVRSGTVCFWIRLDGPKPGGDIVNLHEQLTIGLDGDDGDQLRIKLHAGVIEAPDALTPGKWTHVAVTFGGHGLTLLVAGKVVAHDPANTAGLTPHGAGGPRHVTLCPLPSKCVACAIDELQIHKRALSADEIDTIATDPAVPAAGAREQLAPLDIDAAAFIDESDPTCGLQRAIDAVDPAGGRVTIPVGRFTLRRGLRVPSRVTLTGCGHQTILVAAPGFVTPLRDDVEPGATRITVNDASGFEPGDGVIVQDAGNGCGYNATHACVVAVERGVVHLTVPTWHGYEAGKQGIVARCFPAVSGLYVHDVQIADLTIEGRAGLEADHGVNFTAAAITLERSLGCEVRNVLIRRWLHDGICFGKGSWHRVTDCVVRDSYGHGYHPGNRMRSCTWQNNLAVNNGQDGFYFCCGVEDNLVTGNLFEGNAGHGIGGLGHCNDQRNLVSDNQILGNGLAGVRVNGGRFNTVTNNIVRNNSQHQRGRWAGIHVEADTDRAVIAGNTLIDDQDEPTQTTGVFVADSCTGVIVRENA